MIRYPRTLRLFAICLSTVAGYVDAVGFIALGGFFVSFMSGNTTRLSVGLAGRTQDAAIAGGLIACFVLGVMAGCVTGNGAGARRPAAILGLAGALLLTASGLASLGFKGSVLALVAGAMGAKNTVFEQDGEVSVGLTYMTGTLVKFGQRLTATLLGAGSPLGWLPYFLLWLGLAGGAFVGATAYRYLGLQALWPAAVLELALAGFSLKLGWRTEAADIPAAPADQVI